MGYQFNTIGPDTRGEGNIEEGGGIGYPPSDPGLGERREFFHRGSGQSSGTKRFYCDCKLISADRLC